MPAERARTGEGLNRIVTRLSSRGERAEHFLKL